MFTTFRLSDLSYDGDAAGFELSPISALGKKEASSDPDTLSGQKHDHHGNCKYNFDAVSLPTPRLSAVQ